MVINHSSLEYSKLWLLAKKYIKCSLILIFFSLWKCISTKRTPKLSKSTCNSYAGYRYTSPLISLSNVCDSSFNLFSQIWPAIYRTASWETVDSNLLRTSEFVYWKRVNDPLNESGTPQLPHETPSRKKCHISTLPYFVVCGPHHSSCN